MKRKIKSTCGNFAVYEFDTAAEYQEFIKERADLFRYIGHSGGLQKNGKYRIVF